MTYVKSSRDVCDMITWRTSTGDVTWCIDIIMWCMWCHTWHYHMMYVTPSHDVRDVINDVIRDITIKAWLTDRHFCFIYIEIHHITAPIIWHIGLFKMFSRWIWGIFNIQIQSDRGHKLMLYMFLNKDKDLLGIYQYGCDPFCVSLLTGRHLKVRSNSILFTFSDKGAFTSARDS